MINSGVVRSILSNLIAMISLTMRGSASFAPKLNPMVRISKRVNGTIGFPAVARVVVCDKRDIVLKKLG